MAQSKHFKGFLNKNPTTEKNSIILFDLPKLSNKKTHPYVS